MTVRSESKQPAGHWSLIIGHWSLVVILLAAALLRLYALPSLPPGLNFDEAGNGVAALDILRGEPRLWWRIGGGKEPLWPYLIAVATAGLGPTPLTLRLPAALTGILTVAAVYPLLLALFRRAGQRQARLIALYTMLGLAFSGWHLHFSRLGFRAILLPLLSILAFYFLWSFVSHHSSLAIRQWWRAPILWAALFTALAVYAYLAGRLLIFIPALFFLLQWHLTKLSTWRQSKAVPVPPTPHPPSTVYHLPSTAPWPLITNYYLLITPFLLPLILYFALNPADFAARAGTVSIFNPAWNHGDLSGTAWRTLTLTLGTFLGLTGDPNPLVNLPHQPALPIYLAPFFLLGLATCLYHLLRPVSSFILTTIGRVEARPPAPPPPVILSLSKGCSPTPIFLLTWWLVMLLPALLAPEGAPHHLRLIGAIVPTYALVALGFVTAQRSAYFVLRRMSYAIRNTHYTLGTLSLLPLLCYLLLALQTTTAYFIRWPPTPDFTLPFDLYATRLAADIAVAPPNVSYVLPMDIRAGAEARHYTLDYLLGGETAQHAAYHYLPVDERNAETILAAAAQNKRELRIVRWTQDKHREADAKEIVTFLLETNGQLLRRESFPVYEVETYGPLEDKQATLHPAPLPAFQLPPIDRPIAATFEGRLRLDAAYVQPTASPGGWLPVALTLAPLAPMNTDYKASVRLIGPGGERLAQKDRTLLHNFHQGTSLWPPETVNEYYLLPIPPETFPGTYTVTVVLYDPQTQAPLVADGLVEVPVGSVWVE